MDQDMLRRLWGADADSEYHDPQRGTVARYDLTPRRRGFARLLLPRPIESGDVWENPADGHREHRLC